MLVLLVSEFITAVSADVCADFLSLLCPDIAFCPDAVGISNI